MIDIYLQNPALMKGQPKKTIAEYVESKGFLVPKRFASLDDALDSGNEIIIRSEHLQDYHGASGILESFVVSKEKIDAARKRMNVFGEFELNPNPIPRKDKFDSSDLLLSKIAQESQVSFLDDALIHFKSTIDRLNQYGYDSVEFSKKVSFSFWEKLPGFNRTMVADSSIKNRYHLFTTRKKSEGFHHNYSILDTGKLINHGPSQFIDGFQNSIHKIIDFYESIRSLDNFDKNHCPIIEFQTIDENHFFLQYHRTRDFNSAEFKLERNPKEEEIEVDLVRGATGKYGIVVQASTYYGEEYDLSPEDASFDFHYNNLFSEIMSRSRKVNFIDHFVEDFARKSMDNHAPKSFFFKPEMSLVFNASQLFSKGETEFLCEKARNGKSYAQISIYVISDGRKAYVSRVK